MTTVYILTFIHSEKKYYFTSVIAIFEKFDFETLGIKYRTLNSHNFSMGNYANKRLKVERVVAYSRQDIQKEKKKLE